MEISAPDVNGISRPVVSQISAALLQQARTETNWVRSRTEETLGLYRTPAGMARSSSPRRRWLAAHSAGEQEEEEADVEDGAAHEDHRTSVDMNQSYSSGRPSSACSSDSESDIRERPRFVRSPGTYRNRSALELMGTIDEEWRQLESARTPRAAASSHPFTEALMPENRLKNRYSNVLPFDCSRVCLRQLGSFTGSDYINASHVTGFNTDYICTQAPLPSTMREFWWMVWEYHSPAIVMLTPLSEGQRVKADPYWPMSEDKSLHYVSLSVRLLDTAEVSEQLTLRAFVLSLDGETRRVFQLHFKGWSDFGAPDSQAQFCQLALLMEHYTAEFTRASNPGPAVIHCSAGVGRTGTFLAAHGLMLRKRAGMDLTKVSIPEIVSRLRRDRRGMVQSVDQYRFIYSIMERLEKDQSYLRIRMDRVPTLSLGEDSLEMPSPSVNHIKCARRQRSSQSFGYTPFSTSESTQYATTFPVVPAAEPDHVALSSSSPNHFSVPFRANEFSASSSQGPFLTQPRTLYRSSSSDVHFNSSPSSAPHDYQLDDHSVNTPLDGTKSEGKKRRNAFL